MYFALTFSLVLVAQSTCRLLRASEPPKELHFEGVELTCNLAKNVEGALTEEFAVLFERIRAKSAVNEQDPVLFVLGHEYKALLDLNRDLQQWMLTAKCTATS